MDNSDFIIVNDRARSIYMQGREDGYVQGHHDGHQDAGDAAELAAVRFYTLQATDLANREQVADTAKSLDVPRFRDRHMVIPTIKPKPTLEQFLHGLRAGEILTDRQEAAA